MDLSLFDKLGPAESNYAAELNRMLIFVEKDETPSQSQRKGRSEHRSTTNRDDSFFEERPEFDAAEHSSIREENKGMSKPNCREEK